MNCSDITVQIIGDITDINVIVKRATDAATAAETSATAAAASAAASAASATDADGYVATSRSSANDADDAASCSINAASQAGVSEAAASASATAAQTSAGVADTRKQQADAASQSASQSANAASQSATAASASADRAERAPVRLKVSKDNAKLNETTSEFNFIGPGVIIKQPDADKSIFDIEIAGHQPVSVADVTGLQAALDGKEPALGAPLTDYMVLASKTDGTRYWIAQTKAGDGPLLAGSVGRVQQPVTDLQLGAGMQVTINGQTCTVSCEVSKAELDKLQAQVTAMYAPTQAAWDNAFIAALAGYVTRLGAVETSAATSVSHLAALQAESDRNKQTVTQIENQIINKVESRVNAGAKTITLTYKNGATVVDTDLIDISGMFATQPPPGSTSVWYGFTGNKPISPNDAKAGSTELESVIVGKDIELKRSDATPMFMYVWIPDSLGPITGFSFNHAFLDVWQSYPLVVDGVAGKAYISDNKTAATDVSFEVQ